MNSKDIDEVTTKLFDFRDVELSVRTNLAEHIFRIITSGSLRLGILNVEIETLLKKKITHSLEQNLPITLILGVGGFKNFRIDTAPHIDWAEVFQLAHLLQTVYPIAQYYPPGVHIEYSGDAEAMNIVDNLKQSWITMYCTEFDELVTEISAKLPQNISVTTKNFKEFYNVHEISTEINKRLATVDMQDHEVAKLLKARMPQAENNFCFDGSSDYMSIPDIKKRELLQLSILKHKLWLEVDYEYRRDYLEGGINIPIIHRKNFPGCLSIRSVKGNDIQYWIGKGVLLQKSTAFSPWIMSSKQYATQKAKLTNVVISRPLVALPGLKVLPVLQYDGN